MRTVQEDKYYVMVVLINCVCEGDAAAAQEQLARIVRMYQDLDYNEKLEAYVCLAEELNALLLYKAQGFKVNFVESDALYRKLRREIRRCDSHSAIQTLLREIVDVYSGMIRRGSRRRYSNLIRSCLEHIDQHYQEPLTVTGEAERLAVAQSYLSHRFVQEMGCNFTAYVNSVRIRYACILLERLQLPIQQVAEKVGFASANYFARVFRQQMGMTPRQYRECKQKGRRAGEEGAENSGYSSK